MKFLYGLILILCISCGTGIDSTGYVSGKDVQREVGVAPPEQTYLADIAPEPLSRWQEGKRLYVTDDRLKLMLGNTAPASSLVGQYIIYKGSEEVTTPTGERVVELQLQAPDGAMMRYRCRHGYQELERLGRVDIPFTVEQSMVDAVGARMLGNTYYIVTPDQYTAGGTYARRRKYVPVTVTDVHPGTDVYPVAVTFAEAAGEPSMVYMNVGSASSAVTSRTFASLFSLTDPRKRYPRISDEAWANIVANRVAEGMTTEECRLALGQPATVDRYSTGAFLIETWTYDGGSYLRFEDGILRSSRL